jgi:hypothetical protein
VGAAGGQRHSHEHRYDFSYHGRHNYHDRNYRLRYLRNDD